MYTLSISWGNFGLPSQNEESGVIVFPLINNDGIKLSQPYSTQQYETMKGSLLLIGREQLNGFSVSSIFPNKPYNFINPDSRITGEYTVVRTKVAAGQTTSGYYEGPYKYETVLVKDGMDYVHEIQRVQALRIPWRCILTQDGVEIWNKAAYITSFNWGRDQAGDISFDLSFTEYRFAERTSDELGKQEAPAEAQDTYEVETIITAEEEATASTGSGSYTPTATNFQRQYTDQDAEDLANHILSGMTIAYDPVYWNPQTRFCRSTQTGGYTKTLTKAKLYQTVVWGFLNFCDRNYPNTSLSKNISNWLHPPYFDYYEQYKKNIYNDNGMDVVALVKVELDKWSDIKCGASLTRPLDIKYIGEHFGDAAYPGRPADSNVYIAHWFTRSYKPGFDGATNRAVAMIQNHEDYDFDLGS